VAVITLQMDDCCSFILPIHNVVFDRIREVDLEADTQNVLLFKRARKPGSGE
jgi:hypothetical protein